MYDKKEIILQSCKFFKVAQFCLGKFYSIEISEKESLSMADLENFFSPDDLVTSSVNLAFSSELILKSMIKKKLKTHNLKNLFNKLDDGWKNIIIKKMKINSNDFNIELDKIADSFDIFRYYYEYISKDQHPFRFFLYDFSVILQVVGHAKYYYENNEVHKISQKDLDLIKEYIY